MPSVLLYLGLTAAGVGAASVARPLHFLGFTSRASGALLAGLGVAFALVALLLPAPLQQAEARRTRLDDFAPAWQFGEHHEARVHASPERVFGAIRAVTAGEIRFFQTLTWIRSPRLPWRSSRATILSAPGDQPILDVALRSGFQPLAEESPREIVVGAIVCCGPSGVSDPASFAALERPGFAKAMMNFRVEEEGGGWCRVTTETRVFATDANARRRFGVYWRFIYPGSAFIRRMWLAAIKARAEADDALKAGAASSGTPSGPLPS